MQEFDYQFQREEEAKLQRLSSELPDYNWLENKIRKSTEFHNKMSLSSANPSKDTEQRKVVPPLRIKNTTVKSKSGQEKTIKMAVSDLGEENANNSSNTKEEENTASQKRSSSETKSAKTHRKKKNMVGSEFINITDDIQDNKVNEITSKNGDDKGKNANGLGSMNGVQDHSGNPISSPCDSPDSNLVINCDESSEENGESSHWSVSEKDGTESNTLKSPDRNSVKEYANVEKAKSPHSPTPNPKNSCGRDTAPINHTASVQEGLSSTHLNVLSPTSTPVSREHRDSSFTHVEHKNADIQEIPQTFPQVSNVVMSDKQTNRAVNNIQMYENYIMRQKADLDLLNKEILRRKQELDKIRLDIFNERQILGKVTTRARHMFMEMEEKYQSTLKLLSKVEELHRQQKQASHVATIKDKPEIMTPQVVMPSSISDPTPRHLYPRHVPIKPKISEANEYQSMMEQEKLNSEIINIRKKLVLESGLGVVSHAGDANQLKDTPPLYSLNGQSSKPVPNLQHWLNQQVRMDKGMPPLQDVSQSKKDALMEQAKEVEKLRKMSGEKYLTSFQQVHDPKFDKNNTIIPSTCQDPKLNKSTLMDILSSSNSDLSHVYPYQAVKTNFDFKKSAFRPPMNPTQTFNHPSMFQQGITGIAFPNDANSYGIIGNTMKPKDRPRPYGYAEQVTTRVEDQGLKNNLIYPEGLYSEFKSNEVQGSKSPKSMMKPEILQSYQTLNDALMARQNVLYDRNRIKMYYNDPEYQMKLEHDSALMRERNKMVHKSPSPSSTAKRPRIDKKEEVAERPMQDTNVMNKVNPVMIAPENHTLKHSVPKARIDSRESPQSAPTQPTSNTTPTQDNCAPKCSNCHNTACFICSGCRKAWYCSESCQRHKWSQHAPFCQSSS